MLSAWSSPIKHKELFLRLLEAVKLPAKLAVIHCKGHQKGQEEEAQGNRKADQEAKWAARDATPVTDICPLFPKETLSPDYTPEEHSRYAKRGWEIGSHGWFQTDQAQVILPDSQVWKIINSLHKSTHFGRENLETLLKPILYHPQLAKVVRQVTQNCDTCLRNNPKTRPLPPPLIKPVQHWGSYPGDDWQVDFTAMPKTQRPLIC